MSVETLIDTYCRAWSAPDPAERAACLAATWSPGATYTDPTVQVVGTDALLAHIDRVMARRPGARVLRTSGVDVHHGLARFAWHVALADGSTLPEGLDVAFLSTDGARIDRIVGFFGPLPGGLR